ncbi:MAG: glycosyltransferase [Candidatus Omnitrophica bacterium]|nr:glycosyltransferase [Candidatus Omnitrophota bacterium]
MRIPVLFIIDVLRDFGGAEKNLIQLVSGLNPTLYDPMVCCLKGGHVFGQLKDRGINVTDLQLKRIYSPRAFARAWSLVNLIRRKRVQVVVTYFESSDLWGGLIARLAGVPVVISNRRDMGFALKQRHVLIYRLINPFFDRIITVCDAVKDALRRTEGVSENKLLTVYNGVEMNAHRPSAKLKESLGIGADEQVVAMVANLHPLKGYDHLLIAARMIIDAGKKPKFLFVGVSKNGYGDTLRRRADEFGISGNVIFAGYRKDVPALLACSDICVLASTTEGMSNAILEYMAAGKPVVATDVGGNAELVVDSETGFLVPARNPQALFRSISLLLENEDLKTQMGRKGRERAEAFFSTRTMLDKVEGLFQDLLRKKGGNRFKPGFNPPG